MCLSVRGLLALAAGMLAFFMCCHQGHAFIVRGGGRIKTSALSMASRHLASQEKRGLSSEPQVDIIDPKKKALLQKLHLDDTDSEITQMSLLKTGAELRKERKSELRKQRQQEMAIEKIKIKSRPQQQQSSSSSGSIKTAPAKAVRFVLGNKVEVLTAAQLLELVRSTAPYIFPESAPKMIMDDDDNDDEDDDDDDDDSGEKNANIAVAGGSKLAEIVAKSASPTGFLDILRLPPIAPNEAPTEEERVAYFALCMSAHFATVATYVPTDVDSKIRGHCWHDPSEAVLLAQFEVLKNALKWDVFAVSRKALKVPTPSSAHSSIVLSGHDGEWLGVLVAAWGAFLRHEMIDKAQEAEDLIHSELQREANAFKLLREGGVSKASGVALLKAAAILTHNVGDIDQGLSYWDWDGQFDDQNQKKRTKVQEEVAVAPMAAEEGTSEGPYEKEKAKFSRLAHERADRYGGEYARAKAVYKELLSAEGHRNYPLREPRCLRITPDLMLPIGPFYEGWGRLVATHPGLSHEDRLSVVKNLLRGCDSSKPTGLYIPNQVGYYRALSGMASVMSMERLAKDLDKDAKAVLKQHTTRLHLGISETAFAEKLVARAREVLEDLEV